VFIRGEPAEINNHKERLNDLRGVLEKGPAEVATLCYLTGLEILENDPTFVDKIGTSNTAITRAYTRALNRKADLQRLQLIMETDFPDDLEAFLEWCKEAGVKAELLDIFTQRYRIDIPGWRNQAVYWLKSIMLTDGQSHSTDEVKVSAAKAGIISDNPKDWIRLRQLASDMQVTTQEKGQWKLPSL